MADQPLLLADLSWPEVRDILPQVKIVLIPVGSLEQHGPNIAEQSDHRLAFEVSKRVSARLYPRVLVTPPVPFGVSHHHMRFPGTITLEPETFIAVLRDVVKSLARHGLKRFLFVNGHGGNEATLGVAVVKIQEEVPVEFLGSCSYWRLADDLLRERLGDRLYGHACEFETSVAMALAPDIVKVGALARGEFREAAVELREKARRYGITLAPYFDELTANGVFGDGTLASVEFGQEIVGRVVDRLCEFIEYVISRPGN
jgi:creatinine amidohydrolase